MVQEYQKITIKSTPYCSNLVQGGLIEIDMGYARHVGKTIRSLRMQQKLSQEQLAAKVQLLGCDLTRSALAKIECGQRSIYPDELKALHLALNAPYDTLLP